MRWNDSRIATALVIVTMFTMMTLAPRVGAASGSAPYNAAVRTLREAITPRGNGEHLTRLHALRHLNDPSLAPFFARLLSHPDWAVQTHAALGLAAIRDVPMIDLDELRSCTPDAQGATLITTLDQHEFDSAQLRTVLEWPTLPDVARLRILIDLRARGEAVSVNDALALTSHPDLEIAGPAAGLAAACGDQTALAEFDERLNALSPPLQDAQRRLVLMFVRDHGWTEARDWVKSCLDRADASSEMHLQALAAALAIDVDWGLQRSEEELRAADSRVARIRHALLRLETEPPLPARAFTNLGGAAGDDHDDPPHDANDPAAPDMLQAICNAGLARAGQRDLTDAYITLIDMQNRRCTAFVLREFEKLPSAVRRQVGANVLARAGTDGADSNLLSTIVTIMPALYDAAPDLIGQQLHEADDDSPLQQAMLLGLFGVNDPAIAPTVHSLRRIGANRADSLALLHLARLDDKLADKDLAQLGRLAAGGGGLSEALHIQAGWLYLRHIDRVDDAIAELFDS
jgi:hypothetical protein